MKKGGKTNEQMKSLGGNLAKIVANGKPLPKKGK